VRGDPRICGRSVLIDPQSWLNVHLSAIVYLLRTVGSESFWTWSSPLAITIARICITACCLPVWYCGFPLFGLGIQRIWDQLRRIAEKNQHE